MAHLIDRRLNDRGKNSSNRERFLRRYKTQVQEAVRRMVEKGYTHRQVRLLCEWYLRVRKSS